MVLTLGSNFITSFPTSGCFPSLKVLQVRFRDLDTDESMCEVFTKFLVLEDLVVEGTRRQGVIFNLNINAPELKRLRISLECNNLEVDGDNFIFAPKLESLDLEQHSCSNYFLENANYLFKANIDLDHHYANALSPRFAGCATVLLAGITMLNIYTFQLIFWR